LDGRFGGRTVGHLDKPKAFGASGIPIRNNPDVVHQAIRLKELAEVLLGRGVCHVAYINIHAQSSSGKDIDTIATSSKKYAGAKARALCRRNGEESP
jgi:hypothetical protein